MLNTALRTHDPGYLSRLDLLIDTVLPLPFLPIGRASYTQIARVASASVFMPAVPKAEIQLDRTFLPHTDDRSFLSFHQSTVLFTRSGHSAVPSTSGPHRVVLTSNPAAFRDLRSV